MLLWVQAVVLGGKAMSSRAVRQRCDGVSLSNLTQLAKRLIILRAGELARVQRRTPRNFFRHGRDLSPRHLIRSVVGARVRRALRGRTVAARLSNLIAVLRALDAWAAPIAQRIRRGLTRVWSIKPEPAPWRTPPALAPALISPAVADSS